MIRVMCTGRVDIAHILRAFSKGGDAVFIGGCHLNECNYTTHGNFHAESVVQLCKKLLELSGVSPARLRIELISSGEGNKFADTMNDFSAEIRKLGPLAGEGESAGESVSKKMDDLVRLVPYIKLAMREKLIARLESVEEFESLYTLAEVESLIRDVASYYIDAESCQACSICAKRCPVEAINGAKNVVHVIDQEKCIHCGACFAACPPRFGAVRKIVREAVPPPPSEEMRKIVRRGK